MKAMNLLITTALAITTITAGAKEIKIGKSTKTVTPTKWVGVFEPIDWDKLEKRQDQGKEDVVDFQVMMCDDTYLSVVEIEFPGVVGKDIKVESDNCELQGYSTNGWGDETTLHFDGPSSDECVITIEKSQNGKKIRMHYNLHDAC